MCGIVGFVDKKEHLTPSARRQLIERMTDSIEHRGRDGRGVHVDGAVALGNVRLAILDPSTRGAQPFFTKDKTIALSYNGEIYNFRDMNLELEKKYELRTGCDTETLAYAFREWGEKSLERFKGMFAFSLLDTRERALYLAVDRFSIKPLYIVNTPEWFAWSSEIKSLLLLPGFKPRLREDTLSEFFVFRQVSGSDTLFEHVERVLPAHLVRFDLSSMRIVRTRWWHLESGTFEDGAVAEETLLEKLRTSVREHLVSDVPVGIQLSGGVDSSLVVALASEMKRDINTYSIGLADAAWNEFTYSRAVAKRYATQHHELRFTEQDFCAALPELTYMHDEPLSHSHSVPMFLLAREARKDVKILLSGEGADEVFFGYKRYPKLAHAHAERQILLSSAYIASGEARAIFPDFRVAGAHSRFRTKVLSGSRKLDWVKRTSLYDLATYLPPLLLRQDKMGMAANLENRVPFLDHELVEFGFSLGAKYKIDGARYKILLKQVAEQFLPHDLIYRTKVGFAQPLSQWLRNARGLGRYLALFEDGARGFLDYDSIRRYREEHTRGVKEHTEILWTLINLELWMRIFIDGEKPEHIAGTLHA